MWSRAQRRLDELSQLLHGVEERIVSLERSRTEDAAQLHDTLDRLERLYRRLVARDNRAEKVHLSEAESTLELRRRLRGG